MRGAVLALLALAAAGCAVGPNFKRPRPPQTTGYQPLGAFELQPGEQTLVYGGEVEPEWWRLFGSKELDALENEGLRASPTLAAAEQAFRLSRDQLHAGQAIFWPSFSGQFLAERQLNPAFRVGINTRITASNAFYSLSATLTYVLDVAGGERRTVEGLKAASERERYAVGAAYIALTGSIADAVIAKTAYHEEGETLEDIVRLDLLQRDVLSAQYESGVGAYAPVLVAEQQLASDREALAATRQREAQSEDLVKALVGREPGHAPSGSPDRLDAYDLPQDVPVNLPSQLVQSRPDVREAEETLHQASAEIGVATAAFFPQFTLLAVQGWASTDINTLTTGLNRFWTRGGSIVTPVIQGPALLFQRRAAVDAYHEAQQSYRATVLSALQQTADALAALYADSKGAAEASESVEAGRIAWGLSEVNVAAGQNDEFDASVYALAHDRARVVLMELQAQQLQDTVSLYLASGGGWRGQGMITKAAARRAQTP